MASVEKCHYDVNTMQMVHNGPAPAAPAAAWREAPGEAEPEADLEAGYCDIHETYMTWHPANQYGPGWFSHELADGSFCKGKQPKRQRPARRAGRR
jgi:hypothetical protein